MIEQNCPIELSVMVDKFYILCSSVQLALGASMRLTEHLKCG